MLPARVYQLMEMYKSNTKILDRDKLWAEKIRDWGLINIYGNRAILTSRGSKELSDYEVSRGRSLLSHIISFFR